MSNRPKQKGTAGETAALRWLRDNGFPWTERLTLSGAYDRGDLSLLPGCAVVAEVKNVAKGATGQPPAGMLTKWMRETEDERDYTGADHAALIVKRAGTTDVARWWCYLPLGHLLRLTSGLPANVGDYTTADLHPPIHSRPVCVTVADWTELLRRAGWGAPWDEREAAA